MSVANRRRNPSYSYGAAVADRRVVFVASQEALVVVGIFPSKQPGQPSAHTSGGGAGQEAKLGSSCR
eukprot:scaffold13461_cov166-Amphora_coffeaeformis.AAC.1